MRNLTLFASILGYQHIIHDQNLPQTPVNWAFRAQKIRGY